MNIFDLVAKLTLDADDYNSELSQAEQNAAVFGEAIGTGLKTAAAIGAAAVATVTAAVVALGKAVWNGAKSTAQYGDNVDKMSQKIGISSDAYQEWDYVMKLAGGSVDSLQAGMRTLSKVLVDAAEGSQSAYSALEAVGLEIEDLEGNTLEENLDIIIKALGEMEEGADRNAAAQALLGRSAMDLGPLLNMTAEEIEDAKREAHDLGMVMSEDDVKASAKMMDALTRFEKTIIGIRNVIFSTFLPALTDILDGFTALVSGSDEGADKIMAGFQKIINALSSKVPEFLNIAFKIVMALVDGINENLDSIIEVTINLIGAIADKIIEMLPTLAVAAVKIVMTLIDKIIEGLPQFIDAAVQLIVTLAQGIAEAIPKLIPAIVKVINIIVEKLTDPDVLFLLIGAAVQIISALAYGLIDALPELLKSLPVLIKNVVNTLIRLAPELAKASLQITKALAQGIADQMPTVVEAFKKIFNAIKTTVSGWFEAIKQWGKDMIQNFINGITGAMSAVKDAVGNVGNTIKNWLGFSEPKEGPLSNFHTFAPDMMKLFAEGIKDNEDLITAQIEKSFNVEGSLRTIGESGVRAVGTGRTSDTAINITVQSVLDGKVLAQQLYKYQRSQQRVYGR